MYNEYYENLITKNMDRQSEFTNNIIFTHSNDRHHTNARSINGIKYNFVISNDLTSVYQTRGFIVEIYIDNVYFRNYFNQLKALKEEIETKIEQSLVWQERPTICRIFAKLEVENIENESRWKEYVDWQINTMIRFLQIFPQYTENLLNELNGEDKMNENEIRESFIRFAMNLASTRVTLATANNYANKLAIDFPNKLGIESIFSINNVSMLEEISNRCNEGNDLFEWSHRIGNHAPRAAIRKYIEFLTIIDGEPWDPFYNFRNIILYGVPGVGKTHNIDKLINLIEKNEDSEKEIFQKITQNSETNEGLDDENLKSRVVFTTFHQSFAYEDFIEGFRPNESGQIILRDGIFKIICDKARKDKENNYYLVIDEINRGNISKIFGELITLIEESKRDKLEISLPYSQEKFTVPSNLFIIGTMNSTDKSIALIDIALRRRFTFLELKPNETLIQNSEAKDFFIKLNEQLEDDYKIGHSYFMGENVDLDFVKEYKIKPLLKEYFYGNSQKLQDIKEKLEW